MNNLEKYQCRICKLYYQDKEWAQKCQAWRAQNNSCNLTITKHALTQSKDNILKNKFL